MSISSKSSQSSVDSQFEQLATKFHDNKWATSEVIFNDPLTSMEWSPNGQFAIVGDQKGKLHTVDATTSTPCLNDSLPVASSRISAVSLNLTCDVFASTSTADNDVVIGSCQPKTGLFGRETGKLSSFYKPLCVSFMQDERTHQSLLLIGSTKGVRLVDAESGAMFRELTVKDGVSSMRSWSGCMILAGSTGGGVALCDVRAKEPVAHFDSGVPGRRAIAAVDGGVRVLALAGGQGEIRLFDLSSRKLIMKKKAMGDDVKAIDFSPKMRFLLAADRNRMSIINLNEIIVSTLPLPSKQIMEVDSTTGCKWHPKQCTFISRTMDGRLRLFDPIIDE